MEHAKLVREWCEGFPKLQINTSTLDALRIESSTAKGFLQQFGIPQRSAPIMESLLIHPLTHRDQLKPMSIVLCEKTAVIDRMVAYGTMADQKDLDVNSLAVDPSLLFPVASSGACYITFHGHTGIVYSFSLPGCINFLNSNLLCYYSFLAVISSNCSFKDASGNWRFHFDRLAKDFLASIDPKALESSSNRWPQIFRSFKNSL